jgi:predicted nuclease with TOPRIM domain
MKTIAEKLLTGENQKLKDHIRFLERENLRLREENKKLSSQVRGLRIDVNVLKRKCERSTGPNLLLSSNQKTKVDRSAETMEIE